MDNNKTRSGSETKPAPHPNAKLHEAVDGLYDLIWREDIPSPTCPEYVELHDKLQKIKKYIDEHVVPNM